MPNLPEAVQLPLAVYDEIVAHAREGKPEEICGVMRGRGTTVYEVIRGQNLAAERIENYEVDPQTLLLQFKFEEQGDEMMGIYHSHPVSVAYPSATDAWNAHYPECIYFICSLEDDNAPVLRAFRMITHWIDVDSDSLRHTLPFYETRPHLFAFFQPADRPLPEALAPIAHHVPVPFYVDFITDERGQIAENRVVSIAELHVDTVDAA
jgi:proteasome lid subunit RPN8/RPN11